MKKKSEMIDKKYYVRNIFVISDGQDILGSNLEFSYVEINDRLSKFVPNKIWKSQAAQRLSLKQKIELSLPSMAMQEQCMLEILDEVSQKPGKQFEAAWLLDGTKVISPLELPNKARIIIASTSHNFQGITGMEHFEGQMAAVRDTRTNVGGATYVNAVTMPTIRVKPQPSSWVHMATSKWTRMNETTAVPSYQETAGQA